MNYEHVGENRVQKYLAAIENRSFEFGSFEKKVFHRDIRDFQNAVTFLFVDVDRKFWHTSASFSSQLPPCQILKMTSQ